jgi:RNA polymerase sigma-70 factor (ECF subfamily)
MRMTDEELMLLTKQDDNDAFLKLYERWKKSVFRYISFFTKSPDEAEDILQEAFLSIYKSRGRYSVQAKFSTFLFTVVRSKCIDFLRTQRQATALEDCGEVFMDQTASVVDAVLARDLQRDFVDYLNSLPESQRSAVYLRDIEQLTYEQIAEVLSLPLGTVKSYIHRGREMTYSYLRRRYEEV